MAVETFMAPATSLPQVMSFGSVQKIAAHIGVFFTIMLFGVFLQFFLQFWKAPKVASTSAGPSLPVRKPSSMQKKKGNRGKKSKKPCGAVPRKVVHVAESIPDERLETISEEELEIVEAEIISEEELEIVQAECESDIEAPSRTTSRITRVEENAITELRSTENKESVQDITKEETRNANSPLDQAITIAQKYRERLEEEVETSAQRTYTSSLLLMHREIAIRIARGPPGLDAPAVRISSTHAPFCPLRVHQLYQQSR